MWKHSELGFYDESSDVSVGENWIENGWKGQNNMCRTYNDLKKCYSGKKEIKGESLGENREKTLTHYLCLLKSSI